jgi:hypothetical protein
VAGGAISYIDFYRSEIGTLVDEPGILYSNLHLMGDRAGSPSYGWGGDNLFGAGRIKFRMWNPAGMDAPWWFGTGHFCVKDGETVTIPINSGNTIPVDADYIKGALWFYDPDHETGSSAIADFIYLELYEVGEPEPWGRKASNGGPDAQRVWYRSPGGKQLEFRVSGYDIDTDGYDGCGTNGMRVFWSGYYEDADRDDTDGPGGEVEHDD